MAVRTNTLSGSTSTFHFAIYAIGTGDSTSFCGRIGIDWIWNRHALLANPVKHIGNFFIHRTGKVLGLLLEKWLLLRLHPIGNIATAMAGRAAYLSAALAVGADDPAAPGAGCAQQAPCTVAGGTRYYFVQSLDAGARFS